MSQPLVSLLKAHLISNPAQPAGSGLVPAGVLAPLFFKEGKAQLLFTQRTFTVRDHRGQISFPGGVKDAEDPDLLATALRETREEIGLEPEAVEVLGALPIVATITGYRITPFVGLIPHPYDFHPNPREVKKLLLLPLEGFYEASRWSSGNYRYQGQITRVCYWRFNHEVIWGATARILLHLLAFLGQHPIPGDHDATCLD
ncbi:MAG: CoA pyrophosphatase [Deltaproteobacteria bacterium]|nr:CoA pyrophosphatase [Deltaproteobacteria bacterium]